MPTIEVSRKTLERLAGKKITEDMLDAVKGDIEGEKEGILKIEIGDTNRPDLWSVEGIARVFRERGIPKLRVKKSGKSIIVNANIQKIRPYIAGFVAKNVPMNEELLLDIIQVQEKISENFGRKREKISIGVYNYRDAKFPLHYKAVAPKSVRFAPLEFTEPLDLDEILDKHPKGHLYGHIVKKHKMYPLFTDSAEQVLSFPPIINSNYLGKVREGTSEIFIEVTGSDIMPVNLVVNIMALALQDRGATIESVNIGYPYATPLGKRHATPYVFAEKLAFPEAMVKERLGIVLKTGQIISLLRSMQYDATKKGNKIVATVPYYRRDVMHPFDAIEDIAIAYGYGKIEPASLDSFTTGGLAPLTTSTEKVRRIAIGMGFQEIMSPILSNAADNEKSLNETKLIEIDNYMSKNYSAVRPSIIPSLLLVLSKNLHVEYPQKIFETGECASVENDEIKNATKITLCIADESAGYEDISSVADAMLRLLGVKYTLESSKKKMFIDGRQAAIKANGKVIGAMGEIHPQVLENWGVDKPVVALELDVETLITR